MIKILWSFVFGVLGSFHLAYAQESTSSSQQPFIDQIKREMGPSEKSSETQGTPDSYIQSQKKKLGPSDESKGTQDFINSLNVQKAPPETGSYTDQERSKLAPQSPSDQSAIQAFQEGRSELHARPEGEIHHSAAVVVGTSVTRNVVPKGDASSGLAYKDIYGDKWVPDVSLVYQYEPFHSESFGNFGILFSTGLTYHTGYAQFAFPPKKPSGVGSFPTQSQSKLQLYVFPFTGGLSYSLNLFKYVRPYVMAGPSLIGYYELIVSGNGSNHRGYSKGFYYSGGAAFLLDWISRGSTWELYSEHTIKHYYVVVEYSHLSTFSGDVDFSSSGLSTGLSFEF
jgi:hypothetical protein